MEELDQLMDKAKSASCLILDFLGKQELGEIEVLMGLFIAAASVAVTTREHRTLKEKIESDCILLGRLMKNLHANREELKAKGVL